MTTLAALLTLLGKEDTVCEVCKSLCGEDEHHLLFDCPAYSHSRYKHATLSHDFQIVSFVLDSSDPCLLGHYFRQCFEPRQSVLA